MTVLFKCIWTIALSCSISAAALAEPAERARVPRAVELAGYTTEVLFDDFLELRIGARSEIAGSTWYNSLWYQPERPADRFSIEGGVLRISSEPNGADVSLTSVSRDGSAGKLFRFGYFEARMKWENSPATWAALWLFSFSHMQNTDHGNWCEIDIIESMRPKTFSGTVHNWKNFRTTHNLNNDHFLGADYDPAQWHTYGVLVEPDTITWFFDADPIFSAPTPLPCKEQELFLVLTSQIHGASPGLRPDSKNSYPRRSVYFDWIRVLQRS